MDKRLTIVVEKTNTGFSCYTKEISGLVTIGGDLFELMKNYIEVLNYHIEYLEDDEIKYDDYELDWQLPEELPKQSIEGNTPKEKWENLKNFVLEQIEIIDGETEYSVTEPDWWLQMSDVQRKLYQTK